MCTVPVSDSSLRGQRSYMTYFLSALLLLPSFKPKLLLNTNRCYRFHVNKVKQTSQHLNLVDCTLMQSVHNVCKQITYQTIY